MEYGTWNSEPFLREIELSKRSDLLIEMIVGYAKWRNILIDGKRIGETVDFILEEIINIPYLKLCTIKFALKKFTDENNQNISAAIILAMIKKAYQTEAHKAILKRWDQEDQQNRLAPLSDMQKEELNKKARLESWTWCCENLENTFDNPHWLNAVKYLHKDLQYQPEKKFIDHYTNKAESIIFAEVQANKQNTSLSRDDHKIALKELLLIESRNIHGSDLESRIINLRRKLICKEYILKNVI